MPHLHTKKQGVLTELDKCDIYYYVCHMFTSQYLYICKEQMCANPFFRLLQVCRALIRQFSK